ncbi:hypothetical protein MC7420_7568 [Coleofasciculus chthonoplastes PCC 7420]|uniref:Uncharacterized protein n=1 Tax=Coleofasciculus chthonoplastes PCC 7420 TaxID=118168 RepID=B4W119_9CYAN|nr:hypothetical protein MC7420_7568 [Coleofasciculus chthonoplastes PCC 7420]
MECRGGLRNKINSETDNILTKTRPVSSCHFSVRSRCKTDRLGYRVEDKL